jgi:hypothetical protein
VDKAQKDKDNKNHDDWFLRFVILVGTLRGDMMAEYLYVLIPVGVPEDDTVGH